MYNNIDFITHKDTRVILNDHKCDCVHNIKKERKSFTNM